MLLFDIGANRGDATYAGLNKGYKVIAMEPGKVFKDLVSNFIYIEDVTPLKLAVSDVDNEEIKFYECVEDGLSTIEESWFTNTSMPYYGKEYKVVNVNTITIDTLVEKYGTPDLIKIDVEGAEWSVFHGMTQKYGMIAFEWTEATISEHQKQLEYLASLGYKKVAPQFIVNHIEEPEKWVSIKTFKLDKWLKDNKEYWEQEGWKDAGLRPTADVGMCWVK